MSYCNNCGTELSERATSCPNCGEPTSNKQKKARWTPLRFSILMFLTLLFTPTGWVSGGIALYRGETDHGAWLVGVGVGLTLILIALG